MIHVIECLHEIEALVAEEVRRPLVVIVLDEHEDLKIAEHRQLYDLLDHSFLALAQRDLPLVEVGDLLNPLDSLFAHLCFASSLQKLKYMPSN